MNKKFIKYFGIIVLCSVLGLLVFVPFKIPFSIKAYGKICPSKQWILEKGDNGQLIQKIINYETGLIETYCVIQFNRGETGEFAFYSDVCSKSIIDKGDTIAVISSSDLNERLIKQKGELELAKSNLSASKVGEKETVIQEYQNRLEQAKAEHEEQQNIWNREQKLYTNKLTSIEEYESAKNKVNLSLLNVSLATSQLEAVQTGEKPEQIKLLLTQIEALQCELKTLEKRLESYTIQSPFGGRVSSLLASDTLLVISEVSQNIAFIPIQIDKYEMIKTARAIKLNSTGLNQLAKGKLISVNQEPKIVQGESVLIASVLVEGEFNQSSSSSIAECTFECEPVSLFDYVERLLN
jgi:hypothetical protein